MMIGPALVDDHECEVAGLMMVRTHRVHLARAIGGVRD